MSRRAKPWFRAAEGVWYATLNGKQVSLGVGGKGNESAAWRAWERLRGCDPPESPATPPPSPPPLPLPVAAVPTVLEVITKFLEDAAGRVTAETLALYRVFLDGFVKQHGGTLAPRLTGPVAEAYSRRPTWNPSTRSAFLAVLARAFRFAERSRLIDRTPLLDLRKSVIGSRAADVVLTTQQFAKLCDVSPAPFTAFLRFLWLTGCRPAEASQITAGDVDWGAATATIRKHKTAHKGKRRTLYLPPDAISLLRKLADRYPTGPLLRNRIGAAWTRVTLGAAMRKARQRAALPGKILYGLRHSFATDALAAGVPDAQVAELLGHSSTSMLHRHYSHLGTKAKVMADALKRVR